ncbi:10868_t:CDS:1 [Funneliformis caledonium]|uniref:10868_t:CDS:1 n=1 Tax=Funneliformis caledonium TaxID=1117310 RepID=A0A9N9EXD5_9GLOM|nr:10868_t:CDS:1 [Funneliformis caledonium]
MSSYLLYEIFEKIFYYLRNDTGTLYSCLLVKRSWCRSIVPILWSNPFKSVKPGKAGKLMETYLKFLPCEPNQNAHLLLRNGKDLLSLLRGNSTFIFDYPIYLKVLDCLELNRVIKEWSILIVPRENSSYSGQLEYCSRWFSNKIINFFIKKCGRIETMILILDVYHFYGISAVKNVEELVGFTSLRTLHLDYCCDGHVLSNVRDNYRSIEELWISFIKTGVNSDALIKLIKSQRGLKDFRLRNASFIMENFFGVSNDLLKALMTQKDTLHTVQFFNCQFVGCKSLEPLAECTNISRLGFFNCEGMIGEKIVPLAVSLKKLSVLALAIYEGFSADVMINMIRNSQESLKRISFPLATSENYVSRVFRDMTPYSMNLIGITVCFQLGDDESFRSFLSLLDACPNLEYLCLEGGDNDGTPLDFDDPCMIMGFERLAKIMPRKVHRLLLYNVSVSPLSLQSFLDNCVAKIKYLGLYECPSFFDNHISVIIEYAQKHNEMLKNLIIHRCHLVNIEAIHLAMEVIEKVQCSDQEPRDMEFTTWLEF